MKRLIKIVLILVVLGIYWGCQIAYPSGTLRYRLTVEAITDGQPVTASGVFEVTYTTQSGISAAAVTSRLKGEAVALDFGNKGTLFFLLVGDPERSGSYEPATMVVREFKLGGNRGLSPEVIRGLSRLEASAELPFSHLPLIVRFRNLDDPMSVERVRPDEVFRALGVGNALTRVTIQTTRDPIAYTIKARLPWLDEYYDKHFDGRRIETIEAKNRLANSLAAGAFSTRRRNLIPWLD
jgi:hypothetical protein